MSFQQDGGHFGNFIKAVRSRNPADLTAPILDGHISSALCHTGNISHQIGQLAAPGEIAERLAADNLALETFGRMREHLAANDVRIAEIKATLGPCLKMDPGTERFLGDDAAAANALLTRKYRAPFVVPKIA